MGMLYEYERWPDMVTELRGGYIKNDMLSIINMLPISEAKNDPFVNDVQKRESA